ncbi:MAG: secretin N-terminal domain-containing protein, partial [Magnetococcus sp. DMHC-8]
MNANGHARGRRGVYVLCSVLVLFMSGCTGRVAGERNISLSMRDWGWEGERVDGPSARTIVAGGRVGEGQAGWRMSTRLRLPRVSEQASVAPVAVALPESPAVPPQSGGRRITVQVVHTPARLFFEGLASQDPGINMVVHPEVTDDISVELKQVTVDEAVEIVCEMYQLDCQPFASRLPQGVRGYKIFPWQLTTRTYPVDFLSVVRDGYSQTLVSSGNRHEVTTTRTNKDQSKSVTATPSTPGSGMRTEYKSDFWTDLENTITAILQLGLVISRVTEETDEQGRTSRNVLRERKGASGPGVSETRI